MEQTKSPVGAADAAWLKLRLAHWRAGVLITCVIVFGLILNLAVLGADLPAAAIAQVTPESAVVDPTLAPDPTSAPTVVSVEVPATSVDGTEVPNTEAALVEAAAATPGQPGAATASGSVTPVAPAAVIPAAVGPVAAAATTTSPTTAAPQVGPPDAAAGPASPTTVAPRVATPTTAAPQAAPTTAAPTTAAPTTAAPTTAAPTTAAPTTAAPTTTSGPTTEYLTYTVAGGVGQVILARTGNSIKLYGFYPNSGWISQTESNGPTTVKLKFFNTQTQQDREWKATVQGGGIQVEN